jgi:hypothetical protein
MAGAIAQPTTLRAYKSITPKYSQPLGVRMQVMSLTQAWLGHSHRSAAPARCETDSA